VNTCNHAAHFGVALRIGANVAHRASLTDLRDVAASLARPDLVTEHGQLRSELPRERLLGREKPEDVALSGLFPDAGQAREQLSQAA
jgi:hypothetical protein